MTVIHLLAKPTSTVTVPGRSFTCVAEIRNNGDPFVCDSRPGRHLISTIGLDGVRVILGEIENVCA